MQTAIDSVGYLLPAELHDEVLDVMDHLINEFAGAVPAGSVRRCVSRTRHELVEAGLRSDVVATIEQISRRRLSERVALSGARLSIAAESDSPSPKSVVELPLETSAEERAVILQI